MPAPAEQAPLAPPTPLNVKQLNRIQKRRIAREKLQAHLALKRENAKLYGESPPYSSRPQQIQGCMRRPRGPNGRFLTPEECILIQTMNTLALQNSKPPSPPPLFTAKAKL
ncbi:hypothetical protein ACJQWK_10355 [Exserohilum turcicum]|uniref:Transcriptional activator HAP2 n=1 Tax=Exserohilum turcicum (strain 28A) TaxID=671987 RepID=R0KDI2_EXST2|nr:uncharacterized protein SETTUDRAFT_154117 [Exserohilum turcica Et28A]EOA87424.1 hypothetical protein SETTUDRAFT_154117 [Exserohilum turcica Et28A]